MGEWQRKKAKSLGLQPSPCLLGTALCCWIAFLCPVKESRKQMHREMGGKELLKSEGFLKYSWCINFMYAWLAVWVLVSVPLLKGEVLSLMEQC